LVTWSDNLTQDTAKELEALGIQIFAHERRLKDFEARVSFKFQKFLMKKSLELVEPSALILKTRTDIVIPYDVLQKINQIEEVRVGSALWTTSISTEYPGIIADHTIFGLAELFADLYNPSCKNRNFRSGDGTKVHIDTWSKFLHERISELEQFEKMMGDFFRIRHGFFNWLDNRDLVTSGNKSYLWHKRYQNLIQNENFRDQINFLNCEIGKYVKVGLQSHSGEACFIRRLGPKYDLTIPELIPGNGVGVMYETPVYLQSLPNTPNYNTPQTEMYKLKLKKIGIWQIKILTIQDINYLKNVLNEMRLKLLKYLQTHRNHIKFFLKS